MTAVPILLFIFLTHSDSAYMSESSVCTEVCQDARSMTEGPTV